MLLYRFCSDSFICIQTKSGSYLPKWEGLVNDPICGDVENKSEMLGNTCKKKIVVLAFAHSGVKRY